MDVGWLSNCLDDNRRMPSDRLSINDLFAGLTVNQSHSRWAVRGGTFFLWAAVAGSAGYWGLKLFTQPPTGIVVQPVARVAPAADPAAVARLLGASPQTAAAAPVASLASRFSLVGVVAGRSRRGAALIAVDGKPAKPFRVGNPVEEGLWLRAVEARSAVLAASVDGPGVLTLELPVRR